MVLFRLTLSLAKKMKLKLSDSKTHSTSKLGDWFATDFRLGSKHLILCTSSIGRWPILIDAAPYKNFHERLISELRPSLLKLGVTEEDIAEELKHFDEIHYAKNIDRSMVGQMVDSVKTCKFYYERSGENLINLQWMSEKLAHVPHMSQVKGWPEDMTREAFMKPSLKLV